MIASLRGYSRIARTVLGVIAALLIVGIAGSLWMGTRATNQAREQVIQQAETIVDGSLTLAFTPTDVVAPVSPDRSFALTEQMQSILIEPSDFDDATLYSPEGTVLYSTQQSRVGNELPGEIERIQEALRGEPQTRDSDGTFSVMLPFAFRSGVGEPAVVELSRPNTPIASAASPWRTNAVFLFAMLLLLAVATFGVARMLAVVAQTPVEARAQLVPRQPVSDRPRRIEVQQPGIREEAEARRRAEERAQAAEQRLTVLQDQYRRALEDLQRSQNAARDAQRPLADQHLEERAIRAEAEVQSLLRQLQTVTAGHERLQAQLQEATAATAATAIRADGSGTTEQLQEAEMEILGLRAELEGTKEKLAVTRREMASLQTDGDELGPEERRNLEEMHLELMRTKNALSTAESELAGAKRSAEDARTELRTLRNEEQRATMLADEVRAAKAEVESLRASHRAELVEREAEIEEKVRATREEFQRQLAEIEESYRGQIGQREADLATRIAQAESTASSASRELESLGSELEAARSEAADRERRLIEAMDELSGKKTEIAALQAEIQERTVAVSNARKETDDMRRSLVAMQADLSGTDERVESLRVELDTERARAEEAAGFVVAADRDRAALSERVEELTRLLADATGENAEVNRRLQDFEARRQLELANDEGRAEIDDLLRVTQERLAGQTEKLMTAEDRVKELEAEVAGTKQRMEIVEGELRTHQMSEALREMRTHEGADPGSEEAGAGSDLAAEIPFEDRRATSPFIKELSLDAHKSLTRIIGLTQILKHRRDEKEQTQLLKQLATYAKRLDGTVHDLSNAEKLVDGSIDLQVRKVDLEAIVTRVVEASELSEDHEVRLVTESASLRGDPVRIEQIVSTLLRNAAERAPNGQLVVIRLQSVDGGALISVEDPEPSSDASMSPVVKRLADIHGGWAKVEDSASGGSAFQVFLPAAPAKKPPATGEGEGEPAPELPIVVAEQEPTLAEPGDIWEASSAEQILSRELRRLAELSGGDDR